MVLLNLLLFATHLHCGRVLAYSFYGYLSHPAKGCVRPTWTTSSLQMPKNITNKLLLSTQTSKLHSQNSMHIYISMQSCSHHQQYYWYGNCQCCSTCDCRILPVGRQKSSSLKQLEEKMQNIDSLLALCLFYYRAT